MFHPLVYSSGAQPRNGRGEGLCAAAFGYSMRSCSVQTSNKGGFAAQSGGVGMLWRLLDSEKNGKKKERKEENYKHIFADVSGLVCN